MRDKSQFTPKTLF